MVLTIYLKFPVQFIMLIRKYNEVFYGCDEPYSEISNFWRRQVHAIYVIIDWSLVRMYVTTPLISGSFLFRELQTQTCSWFYTNIQDKFKRFGSAKVVRSLYKRKTDCKYTMLVRIVLASISGLRLVDINKSQASDRCHPVLEYTIPNFRALRVDIWVAS